MVKQSRRPKRTPVELAHGFQIHSEQFLQAVQIIERETTAIGPAFGPLYYLGSHCVELILKSFILIRGGTEGELMKIGHDLSKAWGRATELGLSPTDVRAQELIKMLTPYHLDHRFRYRQTGFLTVPLPDEMCDIISNLIKQIGPEIVRALNAEIRAKKEQPSRRV